MKKTKSGLTVPDSTPEAKPEAKQPVQTAEDKTEEIKSVLISWVGDEIRRSYNRKSKDPTAFIITSTTIVNRLIKETQSLKAAWSDKHVDITFQGELIAKIDKLARYYAGNIKQTYGLSDKDNTGTIRTKLVLLGLSTLEAYMEYEQKNKSKRDKVETEAKASRGSNSGRASKTRQRKKPSKKANGQAKGAVKTKAKAKTVQRKKTRAKSKAKANRKAS